MGVKGGGGERLGCVTATEGLAGGEECASRLLGEEARAVVRALRARQAVRGAVVAEGFLVEARVFRRLSESEEKGFGLGSFVQVGVAGEEGAGGCEIGVVLPARADDREERRPGVESAGSLGDETSQLGGRFLEPPLLREDGHEAELWHLARGSEAGGLLEGAAGTLMIVLGEGEIPPDHPQGGVLGVAGEGPLENLSRLLAAPALVERPGEEFRESRVLGLDLEGFFEGGGGESVIAATEKEGAQARLELAVTGIEFRRMQEDVAGFFGQAQALEDHAGVGPERGLPGGEDERAAQASE